MPHFFEKHDRWGNGLALWVVVGMVFLIPISVWSLFSMKMENEVQNWIPKDNPEYKAVEWYRRHFPLDEVLMFTWEGSSLEDPRVDRLVAKIRGTVDATGKRRGGSKFIEQVRTPHDLIAQMRHNKVPRAEAIERLDGVLIGAGPLRIRLTEYGRARRQKVIDQLRVTARDSLGVEIEVTDPVSVNALAATDGSKNAPAEPVSSPAAADQSPATEIAGRSDAAGSEADGARR